MQDVHSVNMVLEALAQVHHEKVKEGAVSVEQLDREPEATETFFTEDQRQFLRLFKGCFQAKSELDTKRSREPIGSKSLLNVP